MDEESYESVKKFWKLMRLNKLSELNNNYNFQDTVILCEIFENKAIRNFPIIRKNVLQLVHLVVVFIDFYQRQLCAPKAG